MIGLNVFESKLLLQPVSLRNFFHFNYSHELIIASENFSSPRHCSEEFSLKRLPTLYQRKLLRRKLPQSIHNENLCYCLENRHSGNFDRRMTPIYISKKSFQFLCNFGNSISSCCARLLPLAIFHSTFLQHMQFQKYQSYSHLFAFTLAGKWVWISRIHQLCSYTMRKHTLLLHDSNLTLSCHKFVFYHLNRDSGTSLCNTLIWLWFTGRNGILTFLCLLKTDW